jgi:serine phosphatase RsbU (regulator of sigma subunit)
MGVLIISILGYMLLGIRQKKIFNETNIKSREVLIDHILKSKREKYEQMIKDYTAWDEMVTFCKTPDSSWSVDNIDVSISSYKLDFASLYNKDFKLVHSVFDTTKNIHRCPLPPDSLLSFSAKKALQHFFIYFDDELLEIFAGHVVSSSDFNTRSEIPQGYMFAGKRWDKQYLKEYEDGTQFAVKIIPNGKIIDFSDDSKIILTRNLNDSKEKALCTLEFLADNPVAKEMKSFTMLFILIFVLTTLALVVFIFLFQKLITIPLRQISGSLNEEDPGLLDPIRERTDEFGKLCHLIIDFFQQRTFLKEANQILNQQKEEIMVQNELLFEQNEELETQKSEITFSNRQVTSSIVYAKRIQHGVLPDNEFISVLFPESFILFKPRDIISGDFYWISILRNYLFAAVADCTGHGVPGAFMSMLGLTFMNEIIRDRQIVQPNHILKELRKKVKAALHQTDMSSESKDGMDIGLVTIDMETSTLMFAGANRPLWFVNSRDSYKLVEIKGDRMPVGVHIKEKEEFTCHEFNISSGDIFYLFSDGFQDQINGITKEKFKVKRFRSSILSYINERLPMQMQKETLEKNLSEWQGVAPQVDDILVMGIRYGL